MIVLEDNIEFKTKIKKLENTSSDDIKDIKKITRTDLVKLCRKRKQHSDPKSKRCKLST
jgi:hypothetical protein